MVNPLERVKKEKNWTSSDLVILSGCSPSTVYANLAGNMKELSSCLLEGLEQAGYDPEKLQKEYKEFRLAKRKELLKGGN